MEDDLEEDEDQSVFSEEEEEDEAECFETEEDEDNEEVPDLEPMDDCPEDNEPHLDPRSDNDENENDSEDEDEPPALHSLVKASAARRARLAARPATVVEEVESELEEEEPPPSNLRRSSRPKATRSMTEPSMTGQGCHEKQLFNKADVNDSFEKSM